MNELHQVVSAEAVDGSKVRVAFGNGVEGLFDCAPYMADKYWERLGDPVFSVKCGPHGEPCAGRVKSTSTPKKYGMPAKRCRVQE